MKKIVIATVAAFVLGTAALASPAEARCSWNGYAWHCWHPTPGTTTTTIIGVPTDTATGGVTKPSRAPGLARPRRSASVGPGDLAKDRAGHEAGAARIVEIE